MLRCELLQALIPSPELDEHIYSFGSCRMTVPQEICAMLRFLGEPEHEDLIAIPNGESEVNIILGYPSIQCTKRVLYLRHELENGVGGIHLHVRDMNRWEDKTPKVLMIV